MSGFGPLPGGLLSPGLLGIGLPGTTGMGSVSDPTYPLIRLPRAGRCPHSPTLVTLVFDNSGSVTGGNDPIGRRYHEAAVTIEHVGRRCRCAKELVAVLHFDRGTGGDGGPVPLDRRGLAEIERALTIPANGAGVSLLGASLHDAYQLAAKYPRHRAALIVFSDFELFDNDLPRVLDDLCDFPGVVHAAVLRATPPQRLVEDDRVTVTEVSYDSPPGTVAQALFEALTAYRPNHGLVRSGGGTT